MTEAAHDDYQLPEEFEHCLKLAPVRDAPSALDRVKQVVRILHEPGGCPWDGEQTNTSLLKPLLEETYEYIDAVETNDRDNMREELGDMLLQSVFQAQVCAVDAQDRSASTKCAIVSSTSSSPDIRTSFKRTTLPTLPRQHRKMRKIR